jgi:hypothetical protein
MKSVKWMLFFMRIFLVGILSLFGCATFQPDSRTNNPERILFVGNSLTTYNMGLDNILRELAASASPPMTIVTYRSTQDGTVLEGLWASGSRHETILKGKWDRVILQATLSKTGTVYGGITADSEMKFHEYAKKFDSEIRKAGARTVLFMHWQFNEPDAMPIQDIARVYKDVAAERGVEIAPVGLAWQQAQKRQPNLILLSDSVHPNFAGSYLAACVLYSTVFKKTPVGLSSIESAGMTAEQAAFLQRVAWETVQETSNLPVQNKSHLKRLKAFTTSEQ